MIENRVLRMELSGRMKRGRPKPEDELNGCVEEKKKREGGGQ